MTYQVMVNSHLEPNHMAQTYPNNINLKLNQITWVLDYAKSHGA